MHNTHAMINLLGYRKLEFLINRFLIKLSSDIIRPLDDTPASFGRVYAQTGNFDKSRLVLPT